MPARQGGDSGVPATATTGGGGVPATEKEVRRRRAGDGDERQQRRLGFKAHWRRGVVEMKMLQGQFSYFHTWVPHVRAHSLTEDGWNGTRVNENLCHDIYVTQNFFVAHV